MNEYESRVEVPNDYFYKMSMMDYGQPHMAFTREYFQNSVDAGAKVFIMAFDETTDEITIIDDGCGMTEDIIRNKLLVMGGSHKTTDEAIGTFGHAKILIYFSWENYTIHTNNILVRGASNRYSIENVSDSIRGTVSTVKIKDHADFRRIRNSVKSFFNYCDTSTVVHLIDIKENEEVHQIVKQNLKISMPISVEATAMDVFIGEGIESYQSNYIYVRTNGVFMFSTWVSVLKSPIIVETSMSARDIFTQNRDSFKREHSTEYNELQSLITNDNISTVRPDFQKFISKAAATTDKRYKTEEKKKLLSDEKNFFYLGKTQNETLTYMKKQKAEKLRLFVEKVILLYKERRNITDDIYMGFVFDDSVEGRFTNRDGKNIVFINPITVLKLIRNKRQMTFHALLVILHELAHFENYKEDSFLYHNESFVNKFHSLMKLFWDTDEIYKVWKSC
jgi:hypothetical protein